MTTYFIGGAPRTGKTTLAKKLARMLNAELVSTDHLRNDAQKLIRDKSHDIFAVDRLNNQTEEEWFEDHTVNPDKILVNQNIESEAVWPYILKEIDLHRSQNESLVLEGVAITPAYVAKYIDGASHVVFVGNTSNLHADAMIKHARDFPKKDWMVSFNYTEEKMRAMANFVQYMSQYFKNESKKYGFDYYEIRDDDFDTSIDELVKAVITQ